MNHGLMNSYLDKTRILIAIVLGIASTLTSYYYYTGPVRTVTDAALWFMLLTVGVYVIISFADTLLNRFWE